MDAQVFTRKIFMEDSFKNKKSSKFSDVYEISLAFLSIIFNSD
jgi:hypothetical protein